MMLLIKLFCYLLVEGSQLSLFPKCEVPEPRYLKFTFANCQQTDLSADLAASAGFKNTKQISGLNRLFFQILEEI